MFSASLRFNLDPLEKHTDDEIWSALEVSHLKSFVSGLDNTLNYAIAEGGENLRYTPIFTYRDWALSA